MARTYISAFANKVFLACFRAFTDLSYNALIIFFFFFVLNFDRHFSRDDNLQVCQICRTYSFLLEISEIEVSYVDALMVLHFNV